MRIIADVAHTVVNSINMRKPSLAGDGAFIVELYLTSMTSVIDLTYST
jgi:hypothetical protein